MRTRKAGIRPGAARLCLSATQAAEELGVTRLTIFRWWRDGKLQEHCVVNYASGKQQPLFDPAYIANLRQEREA